MGSVTNYTADEETYQAPIQGRQLKQGSGQWSVDKANDWYKKQPYLVGMNYINSGSVN